MRKSPKLVLLPICITIASLLSAQDSMKVFRQYADEVCVKVASLEKKLDKRSQKALASLVRIESRLQKKLARIDPAKAKELFANKTLQLQQKAGQYIPSLDTMSTALKFLDKVPALDKVKELEVQFGKAEALKALLNERRKFLKEQLEKFGFAKQLKKLNKEVYYYSAQLNEYKTLLKDKKKRERKALELLSKNRAFKEFMRKHSQLASLFRLPGDEPPTQASLAGLQTRAQVNNLVQQQVGPNGMQQFRQNMQDAQGQIQQLKNQVLAKGSGSSDDILPEGFKPNDQKTKSFWKRLEYGSNIQTIRGNGILPVTSDIGLSLGYKINDRSILGIGASYKMGWGHNIKNIKITHQGIGLRSFADLKLKGSLWISGGYEMNYRAAFTSIDVLQDLNAWQQSGLIGLSKTVPIKTKFFKKTKVQLLWDFLSYQQKPVTQPIVFRIGYGLN